MGLNRRLAAAAKAQFDRVGALGIPDNVLVFAGVASIMSLATYQVFYGKSGGQTLSQEKPDALVHTRGPRDLREEKAALAAAGAGGAAPAPASQVGRGGGAGAPLIPPAAGGRAC